MDRRVHPPPRGQPEPAPSAYRGGMYVYGLGIFFLVAIPLIVAFVKVKKRDRAYGRGEGFDE